MLSPDIKKTLLTTRPFKYLDQDELDRLIAYCQMIHFSNGDVLLHQGKKGEGMYIFIEGTALVTAKILGKEILNLAILSEGNFVGEVSLIEKCPCISSVLANSQLLCLLLSASYFDMLGLFFPETRFKISKAIIEEICERLRVSYNHLTTFMTQSNMVTASLFSEVIKTFTKPSITHFEDVQINMQQLQHSEFFSGFSKEEYDQIIQHSTLLNTPNDCVLIKENDDDKSYYVILRGAVSLSIIHQSKAAKLAVLGPMKMFGNLSDICEHTSYIRYTTCERAILLKISPDNLSYLKNNQAKLWYKLFNFICKSFVALESSANKLLIRLKSELYNR